MILWKTLDYNGGQCVNESLSEARARHAARFGSDLPNLRRQGSLDPSRAQVRPAQRPSRSQGPQLSEEAWHGRKGEAAKALLRRLFQRRLKLSQMIDVVPSRRLDQFSHCDVAPFRMLRRSRHLLRGERTY